MAYALSVFARLFTIGSFWWLHARIGRLVASQPRTYAFHERVPLLLPLVLYNTGATALVVTDLRIELEGDPDRTGFDWITTRNTLRPGSEDDHRFATAFALLGREAPRAHRRVW